MCSSHYNIHIYNRKRLISCGLADQWKDYEVIDCSQGEKLERWGKYILVRPDPAGHLGHPQETKQGWKKMNGHYHRSNKGGGEWEFFDLPEAVDHHIPAY